MPYSSHLPHGANLGPGEFRAANPGLGADDQSIALIVKYIGTEESGTVTVSSGDIIFQDGDSGAEAASTEIASATPGTIDISTAAEDTIGEALDLINASGNWIAVPIDAVRSDTIGTSAELATLAETQAKVKNGVKIYWDTSAKMADSVLVAPASIRESIAPYEAPELTAKVDPMKPFKGYNAVIKAFNAKSTYASGTSTNQVIEDDGTTSTVVRSITAAATTVTQENDWSNAPYEGSRSKRVLVRILNSAAQSVVGLGVSGSFNRKLN
jgi:hypothetical protein